MMALLWEAQLDSHCARPCIQATCQNSRMDLDPSSSPKIGLSWHTDLTPDQLDDLSRLFAAEYREDFGEWDPDQPYGYAPHDMHVIATLDAQTVGHIGWARRSITVGGHTVKIAGVGGVLVAPNGRGHYLGQRLMRAAVDSMRAHSAADFGYLGCDESVVPFYASCGWRRITAAERCIGRDGQPTRSTQGDPLLVMPLRGAGQLWPAGEIDLPGRPW